MKTSKFNAMIKTALAWAKCSTCARVKVGAVIFDEKNWRILSVGYNGTHKGMPHCDSLFDVNEQGEHTVHECRCTYPEWREKHHEFSEKYEVHAEQNAIYNLIKTGPSITEDVSIVTTLEPCAQCCKAIVALGIKHVYYIDAYNNGAVDYLKKFGVECTQVADR